MKKRNVLNKVSIVVPIYNAELYLGYCINSILSQTYINLEVLLINDGSSDGSLQICNNYARIDKRVKVIDIANGGVGNARNVGMQYATGQFLQFVDSDDVISPVMTEKLVQAMETYKKDVVFCGMKMINLKDKRPTDIVCCTSQGIGKECVLDRETFLEKSSYLLWKTALLESPWNKLFRLDIIKRNHIKFPVELSLGEDFMMNMQYYVLCNGAVFLSEILYYYMIVNDLALTRIYRSEMFENQVLLIEEFRKQIGKYIEVKEEDEVLLAEYTVSKAIQCMRHLFHRNSCLSETEIKAQIAVIVGDKRMKTAIQLSKYIDKQYEWIRDVSEFNDVGTIYDNLKMIEEKPPKHCDLPKEKTPGWLNRRLVKSLNCFLRVKKVRNLEMVRNSLCDYGIKTTIIKIWSYKGGKK